MTTQRTHLLALRAAAQVASVSRRARRIAAAAAAGTMLCVSPIGCATDSPSGAQLNPDAIQSSNADVSDLMDVILGTDTGTPSEDTAAAVTDAGGSPTSDTTPSAADVAAQTDSGLADAAATLDTGAPDTAAPDTATPADIDAADAGAVAEDSLVADVGAPPESCFIPNGILCSEPADCVDELDNYAGECLEGECHEPDFINEEAQACCDKQYANGNFGAPGCTPWGPPAPPSDRGYSLAVA